MKVVRLHGKSDLRIAEENTPILETDETLVRIQAVGLCGSDLHWFKTARIGDANLGKPLVLGHECAGVTQSGQRVAIDPAVPCGECELCQAGHPNLCPDMRFAGFANCDGGLREWIAWPTRCLFPIPTSLSDSDGVMLEPLGVALHALDLGKVRPGMTVGVFGCGSIGLLVIQLAQVAGALHVAATEPLLHRFEAATRFGAERWTPQQKVDVAFECAGDNAAVEDAINAVKPGGRVVLVGIPDDDRTSFSASTARRKGLTIKLTRRMKHTYPRAIQLVESGRVDVRSLVTHQFPLQDVAEAFAFAQRREGIKVIVELA